MKVLLQTQESAFGVEPLLSVYISNVTKFGKFKTNYQALSNLLGSDIIITYSNYILKKSRGQ